MNAYESFEFYVRDKGLPDGEEKCILEKYSNITDQEALDILGEEVFCEGVERAIFHSDAWRTSDDDRERFISQK